MTRLIEWIDAFLLNFVEYAELEAHEIWESETDNLW
jgi:hypothetical protein